MENIVFDKININNFLSIENAEITLSEQGLVLVNGKNNESNIPQSNGAGKSTIFDAIFYTLTGTTLRGTTEVVNEKKSDIGCSCELDFHSLNDVYKIIRYKNHKKFGSSCYFYVNDELLSDQIKKSQELIVTTIPSVATPEVLGSIILLGQGLPYRFSSFTPSKRKDLLETMSGSTSEIANVVLNLTKELSEHKSKIDEAQLESTRCSGKISGLNNTIDLLNKRLNTILSPEEIKSQKENYKNQITQGTIQVTELQNKIKELEKQKEDITKIATQVNTYIGQNNAEIDSIKRQISSIKSGNCPTCGRPYDVTAEILDQKVSLEKELETLNATRQALLSKQKITSASSVEVQKDLQTTNSQIIELKNTIALNNQKIVELDSQDNTSAEINEQLTETKNQIDLLKIKINDNSKILNKEQEVCDCIEYLKRQVTRDFKGYMLQEVINYMSSRSEYYSDYLFTNGKKIKISLSGNKILISLDDRLYENLSGGERQRIDLAVQFALRDMLVITSGFSCNLLVLDEAFDNLDAQGSEALIKLIVSEFSDIDSVFIVTHHSEIDIPYDNKLTVTKDINGLSTVEVTF